MEVTRKLLHLFAILKNLFIRLLCWILIISVLALILVCSIAYPLQVLAFAAVLFLIILIKKGWDTL